MSASANIKKVKKIMEGRKKEIRGRHLSKDPKKAALEGKLFDAAEKVKEKGIE